MNPSIPRSRHSRGSGNPEGKGGTNHTQTLPTTRSHFHTLVCRHQPAWAIGTKACPGLRIRHSRGSGNPEGKGGTNHTQTLPTTRPHFHTFVCRHQPACAIAMKECPGPRSGIDRCGSLSFAIRGIPTSIRPPIRHSGEGRNPEGKGGTNHTQTPPTTKPRFHTLVRRRQLAWTIGTKIVIRCHRIRHSRGSGNPEGKGGTNHTQTPPTTRPHFHTFVCRHQPACAIAMKECPGPRSGIDRCGSLSFAIRGIHSPFAASLRQSGPPFVIPAKAGIQKGWGGVRPPDDGKNSSVVPFSSSAHRVRAVWATHFRRPEIAEGMPRTPIRGRDPCGKGPSSSPLMGED